MDAETKSLIRRTVCKDLDDGEFELFVAAATRLQLDPIARQIYAIKRWSKKKQCHQMTVQTSIDGLRAVAQATREYQGQSPQQWCGEDGKWQDVWTKKGRPAAARCGVYRRGFEGPQYAVALWSEFGSQDSLWARMPSHMLSKCAEALALRKAFPAELSGVYTTDEMDQADTPEPEPARILITSKQRQAIKAFAVNERLPVDHREQIKAALADGIEFLEDANRIIARASRAIYTHKATASDDAPEPAWKSNPMTDAQRNRLSSLAHDPRLGNEQREWILTHRELSKGDANRVILRAKSAVEDSTGKPYVPFGNTEAVDSEPEEEPPPPDGPPDGDAFPGLPVDEFDTTPPPKGNARKAAEPARSKLDEILQRAKARGEGEPAEPTGQQRLDGTGAPAADRHGG